MLETMVYAKRRGHAQKIYDLDNLSDPGSSISQKDLEDMHSSDDGDRSSDSEEGSDSQYEGGAFTIPDKQFIKQKNIIIKGPEDKPEYYMEKDIEDKGFNKWVDAYDKTAVWIHWIGLLVTFKIYRMTYSYFMGRKQFLVLYQKKKFKKHTIMITLISQFLVELPIIICDIVAISALPMGEQLILTIFDTLAISIFLIVIEFVEIARLDKIMKTANTKGHKAKKSAAACEDSDENDLDDASSSEEEDDYPDWRLMLKNVEGNPNLFSGGKLQAKLNLLSKNYDPRVALSCVEFDTGTHKEDDPRLVRSFPTSPKAYKEHDDVNFGNYGNAFDNCYAESRGPLAKDMLKEYSEMGTQAQPSDILTALARKGGDLLTPGLDKEDFNRRKTQKKKRGRKNKYYRQIDAEDDEEADQMSDGTDDDGLDGIKEEDEEDEEERQAKLAKQRALEAKLKGEEEERLRLEAEAAAKEKQRRNDEDGRIRADAEAVAKAEEARLKAETDAKKKAKEKGGKK